MEHLGRGIKKYLIALDIGLFAIALAIILGHDAEQLKPFHIIGGPRDGETLTSFADVRKEGRSAVSIMTFFSTNNPEQIEHLQEFLARQPWGDEILVVGINNVEELDTPIKAMLKRIGVTFIVVGGKFPEEFAVFRDIVPPVTCYYYRSYRDEWVGAVNVGASATCTAQILDADSMLALAHIMREASRQESGK